MTPRRPKVVLVGLDGVRGDAMRLVASRPESHVGALARHGAWSFEALSTAPAVSGPAWTSVLTGVWTAKHGIVDNAFRPHQLAHYPPFLERVPERRRASIVNWAPINEHLHGATSAEIVEAYRSDARVVARAAQLLATDRALDVLFVHFDQVDACGHRTGYGRRNPFYRRAVRRADRRIGTLLAAMRARPTYAAEDWLVVVVADHGGQWFGHGRDNAANRRVPLVVAGGGWQPRPLGAAAAVVDVAATVLHHLGVALRPEWRLDGVVHTPRGRVGTGVRALAGSTTLPT